MLIAISIFASIDACSKDFTTRPGRGSPFHSLAAFMNKVLLAFLLTLITHAYAGEYELYWNSWHQNAKLVEQCSSESKVTLFMQNAISNLGNAERTEANAAVIENIILNKPACFLSALSALSQNQCKTLEQFFIQAPIFNEAKEIEEVLKSVNPNGAGCYDRPGR
jgi:hypothetical protein